MLTLKPPSPPSASLKRRGPWPSRCHLRHWTPLLTFLPNVTAIFSSPRSTMNFLSILGIFGSHHLQLKSYFFTMCSKSCWGLWLIVNADLLALMKPYLHLHPSFVYPCTQPQSHLFKFFIFLNPLLHSLVDQSHPNTSRRNFSFRVYEMAYHYLPDLSFVLQALIIRGLTKNNMEVDSRVRRDTQVLEKAFLKSIPQNHPSTYHKRSWTTTDWAIRGG